MIIMSLIAMIADPFIFIPAIFTGFFARKTWHVIVMGFCISVLHAIALHVIQYTSTIDRFLFRAIVGLFAFAIVFGVTYGIRRIFQKSRDGNK